MRRAWRIWRVFCVTLVSTAGLGVLAVRAWLAVAGALTPPISVSLSPDKRFELRVFSAGQSSIPPDYRAGVSFVLRLHDGWFWSRDTLVAEAALADGWTVRWTGARTIGIEAGLLSFFPSCPGAPARSRCRSMSAAARPRRRGVSARR